MDHIDPNQADADCYNKIVAAANLSIIHLKDISFIGDVSDLTGNRQFEFRVGSSMVAWEYDSHSAKLSGMFQYNLQALYEGDVKIAIKAVYLVEYDVSTDCSSEEGRLFLDRVGKYAAYPYYRAIFASLTDQAGIAMPPLPVLSSLPRKISSSEVQKPKKRRERSKG